MIAALQIALYPLGFIASLFFGGRFLFQWLHSEKAGQSTLTKTFWRLSFLGNITLAIHSLIQMQVHVLVIQIINGAISLRNINLMDDKACRWPLKKLLLTLSCVLILALLALYLLCTYAENSSFFRVPIAPWSKEGVSVSLSWHFVGAIGLLLFSSRFIIQWILSEIQGVSFLGKTFWFASLVGDILCLAYFMKLGDSVNYIGPIFGLIPYIRNLMLIYKNKRIVHET